MSNPFIQETVKWKLSVLWSGSFQPEWLCGKFNRCQMEKHVSICILNKNENCTMFGETDVDTGFWTSCGCGYQWNSKPSRTTENRWPKIFDEYFLVLKFTFMVSLTIERDSLNVKRRTFNAIGDSRSERHLSNVQIWKVFISIYDSLFI